jgi:hypothetical protein
MVLSRIGRQMKIVWMHGWMDGRMHACMEEIGITRKNKLYISK